MITKPDGIAHHSHASASLSQDRFSKTRSDHAMELAADYAELIEDLQRLNGEARIVDMATHLGTSHVTVVGKLNRLVRDGIVRRQRHRAVFLTDEGKRLAAQARERHATVRSVLLAIGCPPEIAERDAEGIEHHISPETLAAFGRFLRQRAGDGDGTR
ncbi:MAG: manganese-binding transcriptional regulator MntR [Chthonomonadales bacterium]|nr:manganese-binding transcriptional regulator MntR [Chthonomonadales bacterium]